MTDAETGRPAASPQALQPGDSRSAALAAQAGALPRAGSGAAGTVAPEGGAGAIVAPAVATLSGPDDAALWRTRRAENFPVALRLLPSGPRRHLIAVYDVARVIDDLGDRADGDRTALLEEFAADLATIWRGGSPRSDVLRRLAPTVHACGLGQEPFDRLIRANLQDQLVTRYPTYPDLLGYCRLSADPVGRIVLGIFGAATPRTVPLSDRVCTALQLIEHWQDVAEDRRAGRVYLPEEDLAAFGVPVTDLDAPETSPALRALIAFETDRAEEVLESGAPLVGMLRGWARLAVAGYVAGGRAAIAGLRRARFDVAAGSPGTARRDVLANLIKLSSRGGRHGRDAR